MNNLVHGTNTQSAFQIFKDGKLNPQEFGGSYCSTLPEGEKALFCFRLPDRYVLASLYFVLPENVEADEGIYSTSSCDGKYTKEKEFYVREAVSLKDCKVFRLVDDTEDVDQFVYDNDLYEFYEEAQEYVEWYNNLPVWDDFHNSLPYWNELKNYWKEKRKER